MIRARKTQSPWSILIKSKREEGVTTLLISTGQMELVRAVVVELVLTTMAEMTISKKKGN